MNISQITPWHLLALIPPLLIIEGFFAGSEIALLAADKLKLKATAKRGSNSAGLALELANHPERILSATLLMTSLCVIGASSLVTFFLIGRGVKHSDLIAILITSPLVVFIGELIPKTIYQRYANHIAPWVAYPVNIVYWALFPITRTLSTYTASISRLLGPIEEMLTGKKRTTRDDVLTMLSASKRETEIPSSERRMIKRIFDFKDSEAKHALIPLVKVEGIDESATIRQALERFQEIRHSRIPVYSERIDNIIGVLEIVDLFEVLDLDQSIQAYVTPARYVAETQALDDVLGDMQTKDDELLVVVDEYGGAVGILTFEDIVEEIVGEISDEYDAAHPTYKEISKTSWLAQARMELKQLNEKLQLELPEGDYETLGGFLLQQFGRIPDQGNELFFDTPKGPLKFTIRKANERQIEAVLIETLQTQDK